MKRVIPSEHVELIEGSPVLNFLWSTYPDIPSLCQLWDQNRVACALLYRYYLKIIDFLIKMIRHHLTDSIVVEWCLLLLSA